MRQRGERDENPSLETVLDSLADEHARSLIRVMDVPRNASELSERSDVPVSTTYRKLEHLESATLIDEDIEIREDGRHTSRYRPNFDSIVLTLTDELELELDIIRPARTTDERLEHIWSEVRKGV